VEKNLVSGYKLKHLDLFSGIGGFSLGLEATGGFETVAFCDYDSYCQKILRKHWPWVTIYDDIKELNHEKLNSNGHTKIDIITGGYPCQPFSVAGRQQGEKDPRHVWPEYFRLIKELRPTWIIGENVSGHVKLGLDTVLENLESEGYSARTFSISASSIGANHQRERLWIIAHSNNAGDRTSQSSVDRHGQKTNQRREGFTQPESSGHGEDLENTGRSRRSGSEFQRKNENEIGEKNANQFERSSSSSQSNVANTSTHRSFDESERNIRGLAKESSRKEETRHQPSVCIKTRSSKRSKNMVHSDSERLEKWESIGENFSQEYQTLIGADWWSTEPDVGRVANGVPKRVDRLKSLGNSLVPHIPYYIGMSILQNTLEV
jgi:DNA (cytosine-5)-methyltransferase 1